MARQGPIQHCGAQRIAPQQQKPATSGFKRGEGHEPQGVIGKMGRDIGEQREARPEAYTPQPGRVGASEMESLGAST